MRKKILCLVLAVTMMTGTLYAASPETAAAGEVAFERENAALATDENAMGAGTKKEPVIAKAPAAALDSVRVIADNGQACLESALKMNGVWYFSTDFFSKYTNYQYDSGRFLLDEEIGKKSPSSGNLVFRKVVAVDDTDESIRVMGNRVFLDGMVSVGNMLYLPGHQVFPFLDTIVKVEDNVICFSRPDASYAQLLNRFKIDDYYFDSDREFGSDVIPADLYKDFSTTYAKMYDTIVHFRYDRAKLWTNYNYKDCKNIFLGYMTDQDGYNYYSDKARLLQRQNSASRKLVNYSSKYLNKFVFSPFLKDCEEVFGMENTRDAIFNYIVPDGLRDFVVKHYDDYFDVYDELDGTLYGLSFVENMMSAGFSYWANAACMIDDNREMFKAVFPELLEKNSDYKAMERAVGEVYALYKEPDYISMGMEMGESLLDMAASETIGKGIELTAMMLSGSEMKLAPYKFVAWAAGEAAPKLIHLAAEEAFHYDVGFGAIDDLAVMDCHLGALEEARNTYDRTLKDINNTGNYTQENLEKLRLSAIMTLIVSKKCYEIMRDNASDKNKDYKSSCDYRINNIVEMLADLYEAGGVVAGDGQEFFEAGSAAAKKMLEKLSYADDSEERAFWSYLKDHSIAIKGKNRYMFLGDCTGDDASELAVSEYGSKRDTFFLLQNQNGKVSEIYRYEADPSAADCSCIFVTANDKNETGILKLVFACDPKLAKKDDLLSVITRAKWEFIKFDANGKNKTADSGEWVLKKKNETFQLSDGLVTYLKNGYLLYNSAKPACISDYERVLNTSILVPNAITGDFWFGSVSEIEPEKKPEDVSWSSFGTVASILEASILGKAIGGYADATYLIADADADGWNELLLTKYDPMEGTETLLTADFNDKAIAGDENGSAAGGFRFVRLSTDKKILLLEYYSSAMTNTESYSEWTGSAWEQKAFCEELVAEDTSGNWVTEGEGTWWGEKMTTGEFRNKEQTETEGLINEYNPDLGCTVILGNTDDFLKELDTYVRVGRKAYFGESVKDGTTAHVSGDLDADGVNEEIYVITDPTAPWLDLLAKDPESSKWFTDDYSGSFVIVAKRAAEGLRLSMCFSRNRLGETIKDNDIALEADMIVLEDGAFVYNGTYVEDMALVG